MSLCITETSKSKREMERQFEVLSLCMQLTKTQLFWHPVVVKRSIAKLHSTVSCYAEQSRIAHNILWHICMANVSWSCYYVTSSSFSWGPVLVCCFFLFCFFFAKTCRTSPLIQNAMAHTKTFTVCYNVIKYRHAQRWAAAESEPHHMMTDDCYV
jgi:hypothetical protein